MGSALRKWHFPAVVLGLCEFTERLHPVLETALWSSRGAEGGTWQCCPPQRQAQCHPRAALHQHPLCADDLRLKPYPRSSSAPRKYLPRSSRDAYEHYLSSELLMTLVCAFTSTSDFFCARSKQCWFWRGKKGEQRCCAVLCARACREVGDFSTPPTLSPSKIHAAVYILPAETPSQLSPGNSCWYCHGTIFPLFVVVMVVSGTAISTAPAALRSPASCCPALLLRTPSVGANICIPHDPLCMQ